MGLSEFLQNNSEEDVGTNIVTIPNVISLIRFCMIPLFLYLLFTGKDIPATIVFAVAAATDFIDGMVARKTNSVSRVGQLLDPVVDRLLMLSGVIGTMAVGHIPIWIGVLIIARDVAMLVGGVWLINKWNIRVAVIFLGKLSTALLMFGLAGSLLYMPLLQGLGIVSATWLPGLCAGPYCWAIWFVYAGVLCGIFSTSYYAIRSFAKLKKAKAAAAAGEENPDAAQEQ